MHRIWEATFGGLRLGGHWKFAAENVGWRRILNITSGGDWEATGRHMCVYLCIYLCIYICVCVYLYIDVYKYGFVYCINVDMCICVYSCGISKTVVLFDPRPRFNPRIFSYYPRQFLRNSCGNAFSLCTLECDPLAQGPRSPQSAEEKPAAESGKVPWA